MSGERKKFDATSQIPLKPDGRGYSISYLDADQPLHEAAEILLPTLPQDSRESQNIIGLLNRAYVAVKAELLLPYEEGIEGDLLFTAPVGGTDFDILAADGSVAIPIDSQAFELIIPRVIFPLGKNDFIRIREMRGALRSSAKEIIENAADGVTGDFVYGLTHPRIGGIAERFGFTLSPRPFPNEVYQLITSAGSMVQNPSTVTALSQIGEQVAVYMPTQQYVDRFSAH